MIELYPEFDPTTKSWFVEYNFVQVEAPTLADMQKKLPQCQFAGYQPTGSVRPIEFRKPREDRVAVNLEAINKQVATHRAKKLSVVTNPPGDAADCPPVSKAPGDRGGSPSVASGDSPHAPPQKQFRRTKRQWLSGRPYGTGKRPYVDQDVFDYVLANPKLSYVEVGQHFGGITRNAVAGSIYRCRHPSVGHRA